jgi:hypothetical protein
LVLIEEICPSQNLLNDIVNSTPEISNDGRYAGKPTQDGIVFYRWVVSFVTGVKIHYQRFIKDTPQQ